MTRWENSDYYARTFSPLLQGGVIRSARFDLTASQVAGAFTSPVKLVRGVTGYTYFFLNGVMTKNPTVPGGNISPAFTGIQGARISYDNSALQATGFTIDNVFFAPATPYAEVIQGFGANRAFAAGDGTAADVGGVGLVFNVLVANMGAGAPCSIYINYFLIPVLAQNFGGPVTPLP